MGANTRLIRKRIKSSQNISQITKAMEMVAASKVKKAQKKAVAGKPYAEKIYEAVGNLAYRVNPDAHPLLRKVEENKNLRFLIILITTNKGLCGGLNASLIVSLDEWMKTHSGNGVAKEYDFITLGKKGQRYVARQGGNYLADFSDTLPFTNTISPLAKLITDKFLAYEYDMVWIAYNDFITALKQEPRLKRILPISPETDPEVFRKEPRDEEQAGYVYLIEPSVDEVLESVLPLFIQIQIRDAILEAEASEHSARMLAMKNATDNANDLIDNLTLDFNKARQQAITFELADISTARISITKK